MFTQGGPHPLVYFEDERCGAPTSCTEAALGVACQHSKRFGTTDDRYQDAFATILSFAEWTAESEFSTMGTVLNHDYCLL